MTKNVYEQFDAAFSNVSASALLDKEGNYKGKVCFKFPKDGAGRLYAYVHLFGLEMSRGFAGGYGYDKKSAAVCDAVAKIKEYEPVNPELPVQGWELTHANGLNATKDAWQSAFKSIGGKDWQDVFREELGITVICVL